MPPLSGSLIIKLALSFVAQVHGPFGERDIFDRPQQARTIGLSERELGHSGQRVDREVINFDARALRAYWVVLCALAIIDPNDANGF